MVYNLCKEPWPFRPPKILAIFSRLLNSSLSNPFYNACDTCGSTWCFLTKKKQSLFVGFPCLLGVFGKGLGVDPNSKSPIWLWAKTNQVHFGGWQNPLMSSFRKANIGCSLGQGWPTAILIIFPQRVPGLAHSSRQHWDTLPPACSSAPHQ